MKLIDMTITDFSKEVDSNSPAPGGGSVSALCSDIGIGLTRMMAHLSFGKKKYEALDESIKEEFLNKFEKLGNIKEELEILIDEDTKSFNEVMKAMKMPKSTEEEINIRNKALEEATLLSIEVPFKTSKLSLEALELIEYIGQYGNQNAITDIGVGVLMLCTGLEGAILNVKVNLSGLSDVAVIEKYSKECEEILSNGKNIRDNFVNSIHKKLEIVTA